MPHPFPALPVVARVLAVAALFAFVADADAKGKRGGSGSSSSSSSKAQNKADADDGSSGSGPRINIRNGASNSSSSSSATTPMLGSGLAPMQPLAAPAPSLDQEEAAQRAARLEALEREQADKAAAAKAAAEAERQAAEKAAAERAATRAAEERAEAARVAAAAEKKRRDDAAVAVDVDRVMQRAMADYPVLKTPDGAPVLQRILARQQALVARGMYPSIALVEAVADHAHALVPRPKQEPQPVATTAPAAAAPSAFGTCRWATPTLWTCK